MDYLLDTNAVINYLDASLPLKGMQLLNSIVDNEPKISVITKIETLGYNFTSKEEQIIVETFVNGSSIINIDDEVIEKTISIRKTNKIKLPDAIIAATALVYDLILISRNTQDFKNIDGLQIIDPFNFS